ncbi:DUF2214 family protein [Chitinivorax sp. B]|uniref:DUF2214 family protein n=1 Tax=Chitinivorax sp. B TaxID=2502235 RepID=UPI0010F8E1DA|nr:DUF2214 family protein [Chitinivorax sp. B]
MLLNAILAWLHYIGFAAMLACLALEHRLLQPTMARAQLRAVGRIDLLYGILAGLQIASGVIRIWLEKGPGYYLHNGLFHAKLSLFVVMGLISLYPTIQFIRLGRASHTDTVTIPTATAKRMVMIVRTELALLMAIPLLATMLTRGVGMPS